MSSLTKAEIDYLLGQGKTLVFDEIPEGEAKACKTCTYCHKHILLRTTTSSMSAHIAEYHPAEFKKMAASSGIRRKNLKCPTCFATIPTADGKTELLAYARHVYKCDDAKP